MTDKITACINGGKTVAIILDKEYMNNPDKYKNTYDAVYDITGMDVKVGDKVIIENFGINVKFKGGKE